jgi:hypothetical protein
MNAIRSSGYSARAAYRPPERGHDNPFVDVFLLIQRHIVILQLKSVYLELVTVCQRSDRKTR